MWAIVIIAATTLASYAGVFRGARFVGRDEKLAPLKTPAWEATTIPGGWIDITFAKHFP